MTLFNIQAVAKGPLKYLPPQLDANALADCLDRLNLTLPPAVKALSAAGARMGSGGHQISIATLDKALANTPLSTDS
jgi:hypothetical protein